MRSISTYYTLLLLHQTNLVTRKDCKTTSIQGQVMGFNPLKDLINLSPNLMKIAGEGEKCCYLERHMGFADVLDRSSIFF